MINTLPEDRFVGKIDWYGGKTKDGRVNKFGFVIPLSVSDLRFFLENSGVLSKDSSVPNSFVVFESDVLSKVSSLAEECLVTFCLKLGKKGLKASKLRLAEEESDIDGIRAILSSREVDLPIRLNTCFRLPPNPNDELSSCVTSTLDEWSAEIERKPFLSNLVGYDEIPSYWLASDNPYYKLLPLAIRAHRFHEKYPALLDICNSLMQHESVPSRHWIADYSLLTDQDIKLSESWIVNKANQKESTVNYEKAKMLSARFAELVVAEFFRALGDEVEDVALHQLTGKTNDWKKFDLLIRGKCAVDVKNARSTFNGKTFVQYTVKQFKSDSTAQDVKLFGVLSPYVKYDDIYSTHTSHGNLIILGTTSATAIRELEKEFDGEDFKVRFGDSGRWPVWVFDDRSGTSSDFNQVVEKFKAIIDQIEICDWSDCYLRLAPISIATNIDIPDSFFQRLTDWQKHYFINLKDRRRTDNLSLAWLYLYTFQHFIEAVNNMGSSQEKGYSPEGYKQLLYFGSDLSSKPSTFSTRPAGLFDPLHTISVLIDALNVLWTNRKIVNLESLTKFELKAAGLLRALNKETKLITVLAYCGGFIEKKGYCGNFPLIRGLHETCDVCGMLKCDICNHCSDQCKIQASEHTSGLSQ